MEQAEQVVLMEQVERVVQVEQVVVCQVMR
jgi:hypothetical protein